MNIFERIKSLFRRNKTPLLNATPEIQEYSNNEYKDFSEELRKQVVTDDDRLKIQNEIINERRQAFINISDAIIESFDNEDSNCINDSIEECGDNLSSTEKYILKWISKNSKNISNDVLSYFAKNGKLDMLVQNIEEDFSQKIPSEFRESKLALDTYLFERNPSEYIGGIMQEDMNQKDEY